MQVSKYASIQVCKYASMQVCKYAIMQVCKYARMQLCKCESYLIFDTFYMVYFLTIPCLGHKYSTFCSDGQNYWSVPTPIANGKLYNE